MRLTMRGREILVIGIIIFAFAQVSCSKIDEKTRCTDIARIDFLNLRMEIPDRGTVQLNSGTAFSSDGGSANDWKISLAQDKILRPSSSEVVRLLRLNSEHRTGAGSWNYVFIDQCRDEKLMQIFQAKFLYGVNIPKIADDELQFVSGEWEKNDPICCPSKKRFSIYRWNVNARNFVLDRSDLQPASTTSQ